MSRKERQEHLAKLKQARQGNVKRTEQFALKEETGIIQEMNDEEYNKHVEENRRNKFIVDDFGLGYDDHGEDDLEGEYEEPASKRPKLEGNKQITEFMKPKEINLLKKKPKKQEEISPDMLGNMMKMLDDDSFEVDNMDKFMNQPKVEPVSKTIRPIKNKPLDEQTKRANILYKKKYNVPPATKLPVQLNIPQPEISRKRLPGADETLKQPTAVKTHLEDTYTPEPQDPEQSLQTYQDLKKQSPEHITQVDTSDAPMDIIEELAFVTPNVTWESFPQVNLDELFLVSGQEAVLPVESDGSLVVYWLDAYEDKEIKPGSVFMMGKVWIPSVKRYESICVIVTELLRTIHLLKRNSNITPAQIHEEIELLRSRTPISRWSMEIVDKFYAFENPDVPEKGTYAQVQYSSKFPVVNLPPGKTFSHVFGTHTTLIELLLTRANLRGPCWIKLNDIKTSQTKYSNCRHEVHISSPIDIIITAELASLIPPPISVLGLSMKYIRNENQINEICMISGVFNKEIMIDKATPEYKSGYSSFTIMRPIGRFPKDIMASIQGTNIELGNNERVLINCFLAKLQRLDPDMIVGHDLSEDFLEKLISRIEFYNISSFVSLGKLVRKRLPPRKEDQGNGRVRILTCGRLLCDTFATCRELIRESNYNLTHLAKVQLNETRIEIDCDELTDYYKANHSLIDAARLDQRDAYLCLELMMHLSVIPLTKQLTNLAGNLWVRSLQNARAERNEMLLFHEFYRRNFIIPDKPHIKDARPQTRRRENKYAGGLVLEPKAGLYDKYILLLDFNSLYPSIIREKNICFTTVRRDKLDGEGIGDEPESNSQPGVLPTIIKNLVDRRKACKSDMQKTTDPLMLQQLEIRQRALKLTANSMYGCLGFAHSRFYARPIAALITKSGRDYLEETVKLARDEFHLDVIYGDTDSIMINTNTSDRETALKMGQDVKTRVNKKHKCLEIEIDGLFKTMLLLKKKKYAACKEVNGRIIKEVKGLDMVRRDWCGLSKSVSEKVLDFILSDTPKEQIVEQIFEYLSNVKKELDLNEIPLAAYIITKQLTKAISAYGDIRSQPHVIVAKKLQEQGHGNLIKHFIPYVIVQGAGQFAERAKHPDDLGGVLEIDKNWYVSQQIIPPLLRLCKQIEGVTASQIADCLGQDPKKYENQDLTSKPVITKVSVESYKDKVDILMLTCPSCKHSFEFPGYSAEMKINCPSCSSPISLNTLRNLLSKNLKVRNQRYHKSIMKCINAGCTYKSANTSQVKCNFCHEPLVKEYSLENLHDQLIYYKKFLDPTLVIARSKEKHTYEAEFKNLMHEIQLYLTCSAYQNLDTRKLNIPKLNLHKVLI